jgi:citrate lyase subunit beta / citryl-CoA lyase
MPSSIQAAAPQQMIARSYLFVPGDRPDRFDKACSAGADVVIVDLEDAVPPTKKNEARAAIGNWLSAGKAVVLRINADTTEWFREDLHLARAPGVAGILLPKAERIDRALRKICTETGKFLLPQIETAQGFANARALASGPGVQRLLFGTLDFQMDLGIDGEGEELAYYRSEMVLISRLAGIQPPVDGPCTVLDDAAQLTADTRRAKRMGFGGKLCIHPKQVPHVNAVFAPTADELSWARRVVAAAAESKGAAVALDGRMVDRPVILKAEQIVREATLRASKTLP